MNGINKATVSVVSAIALIYAALCFYLTISTFITNDYAGIHFFLFCPYDGSLGIDLTEKLPEQIGNVLNYYEQFLDKILSYASLEGTGYKYAKLILILIGFVLPMFGFVTKAASDCEGKNGNPAQYLWTHRPKSFLKCLAMPWDLIAACWMKFKPLVIIPILLIPFYLPWAIMLTVFLIIPYVLTRAFIGSKISSAAKIEAKEYSKNTDFGVCPNCKRNFDRPKIKCRCGLILDYPVPNMYGYAYHTCNKGHDIPCISGKRSNLTTICPYCDKQIATREALPITVSFVGALGSGKTTMMLAATQEIAKAARLNDITVESPSSGLSKNAITAKDYAPKTASGELESQCLFIRATGFQDREIIFNDISGAEFQPNPDKVMFEEYYNYTNGIIFTIDATSLKRAVKKDTPQEVFDSFHFMFTSIRNIRPDTVSDVPFAVVLTKADAISPALKDENVRKYLTTNGETSFIKLVESLFSDVKYFAVSSVGDSCPSSMKPVWWIAGHTDKELVKRIPAED